MTDLLRINLENCYGIKRFTSELEFKHKGFAIYAPNGVMKTSFAKTMADLSKGNQPKDLVFPDRESVCELILNDQPLKKEEIFVVHSYDENYSPEGISTLLAHEELKARYEEIHREIGNAKKSLDKKLRIIAGFGEKSRENIDRIIEEVFESPYYDALDKLEEEINSTEISEIKDTNYKKVFDPKVVQLLSDQDVAEVVEDFAKKYDELTEKSPILRKDFHYHNVNQVHAQLDANRFFNAGHSINLTDKNTNQKIEIGNSVELQLKIKDEQKRVLEDEELRNKFDNFNQKIKNKEHIDFREYITNHQYLLPYLKDLTGLRRALWIQYIKASKHEYDELIEYYRTGQQALREIIEEARENPNDWDEVVKDFNRRFLHLPFNLRVGNKTDVILRDTAPSIEFVFKDGDNERIYAESEKNELIRVLSTGEARALYILNIMFEVYTKWKNRKKTVFIFDDIADSFDYKNKFAIIDYLEDIVNVDGINFLTIVLTHNFDFLRTIESRFICPTHQCRMATKNNGTITLKDFKQSDIQNPFHKWKKRLHETIIQVAYIPLLRNVIEYTHGKTKPDGSDNIDYLTLTKMLHYKDNSEEITVAHYKNVFHNTFPSILFPDINEEQRVLDLIFSAAEESLAQEEGINLEHKITLSIAIRLKTEKFIISKIRANEPDYDTARKQTGQLIRDFRDRFNNQEAEINLLRRVGLITPSNIHINAFMYEPILDMGFVELTGLYRQVQDGLN